MKKINYLSKIMGIVLAMALILSFNLYPTKKVHGGYYSGYYKYRSIKAGYESIRFLTWVNYNGFILEDYYSTSVTGFSWQTSIDDYDFINITFR